MRRLLTLMTSLLCALAWPLPAGAQLFRALALNPATPGQQCRAAIQRAEQRYGLPPRLLGAIGRVESGRRGPDGHIDPWPWSINVEGEDHVYETRAEVLAAVRLFQAQGIRSIDVGCLQVNLMYHPEAFETLEDGFDPERNADYAARFLVRLRDQTGTWEAATAAYHSATPSLGGPYAAKVMAVLPEEPARPAATLTPAIRPVASTLGPLVLGNPAAHPEPRLLLLPAGAGGRSLAAYRAAPVPLVRMVGTR